MVKKGFDERDNHEKRKFVEERKCCKLASRCGCPRVRQRLICASEVSTPAYHGPSSRKPPSQQELYRRVTAMVLVACSMAVVSSSSLSTVAAFSTSTTTSPRANQRHVAPGLALSTTISQSPRAFLPTRVQQTARYYNPRARTSSSSSTRLHVLNELLQSVVAGSIAGAIGIGVAFPLDSIRTKTQIMRAAANKKLAEASSSSNSLHGSMLLESNLLQSPTVSFQEANSHSIASAADSLPTTFSVYDTHGGTKRMEDGGNGYDFGGESMSYRVNGDGTLVLAPPNLQQREYDSDYDYYGTSAATLPETTLQHRQPMTLPMTTTPISTSMESAALLQLQDDMSPQKILSYNMMQMTMLIWKQEGLAGFFSGVKSMMLGQAIIKAMAFSTNANTITFLEHNALTSTLPHWQQLLMAACFAGFCASFVVAPVERVTVIMQAQTGKFASEWDCLQAVLKQEGLGGLCTRGLGVSLAREVPSDGIYFWLYGVLIHSSWASMFAPSVAPLIFGAVAGMTSWIPIYPVDVVKTVIQNTNHDDHHGNAEHDAAASASAWDVTRQIYRDGGIAAFYDGVDAKLLRAAVHHAVTFEIYDMVMKLFHATSSVAMH